MTPYELDRRADAVIRELEDLAELRTIPGDIHGCPAACCGSQIITSTFSWRPES